MRSLLSRRPSPAMAVALTALFVSLGGIGYAASTVPDNSVGTRQLKDAAVTAAKLRAPPDPTTAAFSRDPLGVVRLKGQIIGGHGDTVFTLPIAFRPRHDVVESIYAAGDQGGTVLICGSQFKCAGQPGDVIVSDPHGSIPTNVAVSLDGVTFQAGE